MNNLKSFYLTGLAALAFCAQVMAEIDLPVQTSDKSPKEIIERYIEAIGGKGKIQEIKNVTQVMEANVQGMEMEISSTSDQENKRLMQQTALNGNVMSKTVVRDGKGYISAMGQTQDLEGDQLDAVNMQMYPFPELHYEEMGFTLSSGEISEVDGEKAYTIMISTPQGMETKEYYSMESGLKLRVSSETTGEITYGNYQETEGILFPMLMTISNQMLPSAIEAKIITLRFNDNLDPSLFE
ncbi:peptidase, M16 family protein [Pleomorphovibrio marinus]|uniref:peptidase, M16 family protein n=1 Tax=Pleomorphovibrio marinus TaxID=2164132 RepID=UPI000E0B3907|nr:peptidase, M16 family protein [Pleomorphovibrio marinus]